MQLPNPLEVGVLLGQDDPVDIELRDGQAVFFKAGQHLLPQILREDVQLFVNFQNINGLIFDHRRQVGLHGVGDQGTEHSLQSTCNAVPPGNALAGAHQFDEQLAGVLHLQIQFAGSADLQRHAGEGVDKTHLLRGAPLEGHPNGLVDEVDLAVEGALGVRRQLVELFQNGELLCLQRVASRTEEIQRLTVAEEDGLLAFVDDELGAEVEVLDGVLPDQCFAVALILDDAGKAVALYLLGFQALRHIVDMVADGAYVGGCTLGGTQTDPALTAGEFHGLVLLCHGVDGLAADRALGLCALALVKDHIVPAVGTGAACQLVRADIDGAAAGTVDFLSCKEPGLCFRIAPAVGTFNDKFRHSAFPPVLISSW